MHTVRLTTDQAIVRWLLAQRTLIDDQEAPVFAGAFGIFGHGNVTALAEALEPVQEQFPTWRGQNEQYMTLAAVAFTKARLRKQIMVSTTSSRMQQPADCCSGGLREPATPAHAVR